MTAQRTEIIAKAMQDLWHTSENWDKYAENVLTQIDAYDVQQLLLALQAHVQIPLPTIIESGEPKTQFDYVVEVIEGALKARILTQVNRLPINPEAELLVRRTIMETK